MDECVINVEVFGGLNNENFSEVEFDWKGRLRRLWEEMKCAVQKSLKSLLAIEQFHCSGIFSFSVCH